MASVKESVEELLACTGDWEAFAGCLERLRREKGPLFCRQMAGLVRDDAAIDFAAAIRAFPDDRFGLLLEFIAAMPYRPNLQDMPCGKKERAIADALSDRSIPKARRVQLWRTFVMQGFKFPRYQRGATWQVPEALLDHTAVREWIVLTRGKGAKDLRNSDPMRFGSAAVPNLKTEFEQAAWKAIEQDSPAGLMMPLALMGKKLPRRFLVEVLSRPAKKILVYLISHGDSDYPPRELLFYLCANWNNDEAIPAIELIEKLNPGLVASAVDDYGHNALWYTLYQRNRFGRATAAARRAMDPLDIALIELGCNPNQESFLGLSWQDVAEPRDTVPDEV